MEKVCTGCKKLKPFEAFYNHRGARDGKTQRCAECMRASHEVWLAANPTYGAENARRYYAKNREIVQQKARETMERKRRNAGVRTREERVAADKLDRAKRAAVFVTEKVCSSCGEIKPRREYNKNKSVVDGLTAFCRGCASLRKTKWAFQNADKLAAYDKLYREQNPDRVSAIASARRARMYGNGGSHTAEEVQELYQMQGGICANPYCCADLGTRKKHLDHMQPIARGGSDNIENLQWLCSTCNHRKHAKTVEEWLDWLARRHTQDPVL